MHNREAIALRSRTGQPRRRGRGQSLVELALALPLLLVLVFGIIEFGVAFRTYQIVTNVAREGARLAVTPNATQAAVQTRIDGLLTNSNLNAASATVSYSCNGVPGLCSNTGDQEQISISYPHQFVVLGPVMNLMCAGCGSSYGTVTLSTSTIMRQE